MVVCFTKIDKMLGRMLFYSLTRFYLWMSKGAHGFLRLWLMFWKLIGSQNILPLYFFKLQINIISSQNFTCWNIVIWRKTNVAYVKDEGFNLNTMTITLKSIICFEILGLEESIK
jgi:hypothetical protein